MIHNGLGTKRFATILHNVIVYFDPDLTHCLFFSASLLARRSLFDVTPCALEFVARNPVVNQIRHNPVLDIIDSLLLMSLSLALAS